MSERDIYNGDVLSSMIEILPGARRTPRALAIIAAQAVQQQEIEDAALDLRNALMLPTASGAWLDLLGRVVGEPREGLSDQDYRRFIAARLAVNASEGAVEQLLNIGRLLIEGAALYYPAYPAGYLLLLVTVDPLTVILQARIRAAVEQATASGVGVDLIEAGPTLDDVFLLDSSTMDGPDTMGRQF